MDKEEKRKKTIVKKDERRTGKKHGKLSPYPRKA